MIETVDGKHYNTTMPIMRALSDELGRYKASDQDAAYFSEAVIDLANDWHAEWTRKYFASEELRRDYLENGSVRHAKHMDVIYAHYEGPYAAGHEHTYRSHSPIFLSQMIYQDKARERLQEMPNLQRFVEAMESRPNLKEYLHEINTNVPKVHALD
ncbi:hypothetical protein VTP01DRAFT_8958 [Rhizomucor pusillus]|uniref:uncharacterized protein n=1 Tax=Rhizomucor pusillus TaxID=4840 RepID=UPI003743A4A9